MSESFSESLFDDEEHRPLSVGELNSQIKTEMERRFASVWVEGEIVGFSTPQSGHWYFSLSDGDAKIKCACWKGTNFRIRFKPSDGLQVRVRGKISVYEPRGEYQLIVESLEPVGEGALQIAFEQIKAKLEREGLFAQERKRALPFFPRHVAVVTSPTGAAIHDIVNVLTRRTKSVNLTLIPALVQGENAGFEVAAAINLANKFNEDPKRREKIDVLIVGRGGGSAEDLWAFNEEIVARAIFESKIPVISAVGHEIDFTIADFVADMRAPTPSAAAEIVAESESHISETIERNAEAMCRAVERRFMMAESRLQRAESSAAFAEIPNRVARLQMHISSLTQRSAHIILAKNHLRSRRFEAVSARLSPDKLAKHISQHRERLERLSHRTETGMESFLNRKTRDLGVLAAQFEAMSPMQVLSRGFSITQSADGKILRSAGDALIGEELKISLAKGKIRATVTTREESAN